MEETKTGGRSKQYIATLIVNIVAFTYGTIVGWPANAIPILQSSGTPLDTQLSADEASWIGSLMCLSAAVSTPLFSYIGERSGRKLAGYIVAVPLIVSWLMVIWATDVMMLYASRIVVGLGAGGIFILCPLYVGEIAEDSIRGALGTFLPFLINAGILFAFFVGSYVNFVTMAIVYLMMPIAFLVGFPFLPETPMSLLSRDLDDEALKSLQWLRGTPHVDDEMACLKATVKEMKGTSNDITWEDLTRRGTVTGLVISLGLCVNQQMCGIFAIMTYAVDIFQASDSALSPNMCTVLLAALQLGASVIAVMLMDRAGRKMLLMVSNSGMSICLATIGCFFYLKEIGTDMENFGWVPLVSLSLYVVSFGVGMGPVPFVMISELFSSKIRGLTTALALLVIWILAFAVAKLYPTLTSMLGLSGFYWLFGGCCICGTIFAIFVVPETKNRTLESILKELNGEDSYSRRPSKSCDSTFPVTNV